jgi:hypothetical protein
LRNFLFWNYLKWSHSCFLFCHSCTSFSFLLSRLFSGTWSLWLWKWCYNFLNSSDCRSLYLRQISYTAACMKVLSHLHTPITWVNTSQVTDLIYRLITVKQSFWLEKLTAKGLSGEGTLNLDIWGWYRSLLVWKF